jgi:endoribonuclease Dicer
VFVKICLQVFLCRTFQIALLRVLKDHNLNNLKDLLGGDCSVDNIEIDYLLLPATGKDGRPLIDWESITSVHFSFEKFWENHLNCSYRKGYARCVETIDGSVCTCMLQNSVVYTPHSGHVYCITGISELIGNSVLKRKNGRMVTYKEHFEEQYVIIINF